MISWNITYYYFEDENKPPTETDEDTCIFSNENAHINYISKLVNTFSFLGAFNREKLITKTKTIENGTILGGGLSITYLYKSSENSSALFVEMNDKPNINISDVKSINRNIYNIIRVKNDNFSFAFNS